MVRLPNVSNAYVAASYASLGVGSIGFCIGLWNATTLALSEQGYYFTLLAFGLFAAVAVQKNVRDKEEGLPVGSVFFGLSYVAMGLALLLLVVGLWNAPLALSEKGFYAMSFLLALFSAVTVQKNVRDAQSLDSLQHDFKGKLD